MERVRTTGAQPAISITNLKKLLIPLPPLEEQQAIADALSAVDDEITTLADCIAKKRDIKQGAMQRLLTGEERLPGFSSTSGYKQTEVGVIPVDWVVTNLENISIIKTGPFGAQLHQDDYVQSGTPIITMEHLSEFGVTIDESVPMVSNDDKERLRQYILQKDDIVFSRVGSIDRSSIITKDEEGWLFSGRLLRLRPIKKVDAIFLNYIFQTESFKQRVRKVAVGQTMPSLNTKILNNIIIPLPPLEEQQAIATVLSDIDSEITALEAQREKTIALKQGMMQELLTGKTRLI